MGVAFAVIGFLVAFLPMASFLLIPLELFLVYSISEQYNAFQLMQFIEIGAFLVTFSAVLKGIVQAAHFIPGLGQVINGAVAALFILAINHLATEHYSHMHMAQST